MLLEPIVIHVHMYKFLVQVPLVVQCSGCYVLVLGASVIVYLCHVGASASVSGCGNKCYSVLVLLGPKQVLQWLCFYYWVLQAPKLPIAPILILGQCHQRQHNINDIAVTIPMAGVHNINIGQILPPKIYVTNIIGPSQPKITNSLAPFIYGTFKLRSLAMIINL